jgi:hypothetical protein
LLRRQSKLYFPGDRDGHVILHTNDVFRLPAHRIGSAPIRVAWKPGAWL